MSINNFFNNLNNGVDEQLEIALLSEFAKSCGIRNNSELASIESKVNFRTNSPSYLVNSDTFKNQTRDGFRDNISLLVYDIFFDLLKTDLSFFTDMQETLINFSQNLISADSLRLIILDSISEEVDDIFLILQKAESEGKNVTNEEVRKKIKNALTNNSKEINNNVVAVSNKTTSDGLSNYTPYTKLALSQRQKGIRWRPVKGTTLSPKALERIKKQTDKLKTNLEKVKSGLKTAKSIVSLLKQLESVYSNGIAGILKSLSKIIFSYIRDIGSTGVYMLNMCEPYMTIESFIKNDYMLNKAGDLNNQNFTVDDYHRFMLHQKISREKIIDSNSYAARDLDRSTILINELKPELQERINKETLDKWKDSLCGLYKPTTYAEFIQTISEAFMDEGDMPSPNLELGIFKMRQVKGSIVRERGITSKMLGGSNLDSNWIRPGRPRFGKGSNATVVIVAFSLPNFIKLVGDSISVVKIFINFFRFFGMKDNTGNFEIEKWLSDNTSKIGKRWNRLWGKTTSTSMYDYYSDPPVIDDNGNVISPVVDSEDPDFYGIAIKSLLPDFFEFMDIIESRIDKYINQFKSSLSKELNNLLKNIEELIDDLEDFIQIIDDVIAFFETLKDMGLYTLQITSNGGNQDIIEKIKIAEGFPGVEEGDKLRLIGGLVFCYGTPNLKPNQIDFSGMVKQKMTMMNYEASKAKYEANPDSTEDPGSFEDYANDQGLMGNLGSSLDKIFKKLF